MTDAPPDSLAFVRRVVALAEERRAEEPVALDVRGLVDYTDYFVLLTGRSLRQNQAIADHLVRSFKQQGRYAVSKAGVETGSWICLDFGDAVVHVFDPPTRARYDLELLWADAPHAPLVEPAPAPAPKPKRARVVRKSAVADADAENAPDSARPPLDEPEPVPSPVRRPRAGYGAGVARREKAAASDGGAPRGRAKGAVRAKGSGKGAAAGPGVAGARGASGAKRAAGAGSAGGKGGAGAKGAASGKGTAGAKGARPKGSTGAPGVGTKRAPRGASGFSPKRSRRATD